MTSTIIVLLCVYLIFGITLTVGVFGNMPIIIEGFFDLARMVLLWPVVLWRLFGEIAVVIMLLIYLLIAWPLYWVMQ